MQMHLEVDNSFFPHFQAMIESFVKDHKVSILNVNHDAPSAAPASVVLSSVAEVQRRALEAELQPGISSEEYEKEMEGFFRKELGITR